MTLARVLKPWWRGASDPESALLGAARQGSSRAFDELRRLYDLPLRGFIARRVGRDGAEDMTQEIWLACWQALPKYEGRSRFKAWLYGIAVHKCADYLRAQALHTRRQEILQGDQQIAPDAYEAVVLHQTVQEALEHVPNDQREVLELYYYAELTLAEIAQMLERNLNTVKYQFYRAHTRVAQELKTEDETS